MALLQVTASPDDVSRKAAALMEAGRLGAARPMLAALRLMAPGMASTSILSARLAIREGQPDAALAEIDARIRSEPDHVGLRKCRAELRLLLNDPAGAAGDAAEAVVLDRHDATAKAMLGVMLLELSHHADALACLREAVADEPDNFAFRQGVAAAQQAAGDYDGAAATLAACIAIAPSRLAPRTGAILLAMRRRRFAEAADLARAACRAGVADACVLGLLGHALSSLGRHDEAGDAYAEALKLGPDDAYVRHLASAAGTVAPADRAPLAYLRAVFDGCADTFETSLLGLGYRIPGLIRAALLRHIHCRDDVLNGPVLDLGCGTGLLAVALSDLRLGPITGVDASPGMLAYAAAKQLYAELMEADVIDALRQDRGHWRIMLAADVLCYFGPLDPLFRAAFARLEPGGLFLASVELLGAEDGTEAGWVLGRLGRYRHTLDCVARAAAQAGFVIREMRHEAIRHEAGSAVPGLLVVLERPADAHSTHGGAAPDVH